MNEQDRIFMQGQIDALIADTPKWAQALLKLVFGITADNNIPS